jgi:hypothetical protein
MNVARFLVLGAVLLFFPGLAAADANPDFNRSLAQGYAEIAKFAVAKLHDQSGQSYFQNKSDRAQAQYPVDPEWPTNWNLPRDLQQTMAHDRDVLVQALGRLAAGVDAKTEAIAQVNFDCWVALSSISSLKSESARCRGAFYTAIDQLRP